MMIGDSEVWPGPFGGAGNGIGIGIGFGGAGDVVASGVRIGTGTGGCELTADDPKPFMELCRCVCMADPDSGLRTPAIPFGCGRGVIVNGPDEGLRPVPDVDPDVPLLPPRFGLPLPLPRPPLLPSFSPLILSFRNRTM